MIEVFKIYGQNLALDTKTGAAHKISELQVEIISRVSFPLTDELPVDLRYALAKYESQQLRYGYFSLKKLCDDGVFSAEEGVLKTTAADASGYEAKAKAIIRYNMGRSEAVPDSVPEFDIPFVVDKLGYTYISKKSLGEFLEDETQKKIIQCAIAVHFSKKEVKNG